MTTGRLIVFSIACLMALAIFAWLGFWQLERLQWKRGLILEASRSIFSPPTAYPLHGEELSDGREFRRVMLTGQYMDQDTIKVFVPSRGREPSANPSGYGYLLFTPLRFDGGEVMVNRGYVHAERVPPPAHRPAPIRVSGIIRSKDEGNFFTPGPDYKNRVLHTADVETMSDILRGGRQPGFAPDHYIELDESQNAPGEPQGRNPETLLAGISNRHLEYALTWFGLGMTLLLFYGAVVFRWLRSRNDDKRG
jgi:surfeit locus 1 family protein